MRMSSSGPGVAQDLLMNRKTAIGLMTLVIIGLVVFVPFVPFHTLYPPYHCPKVPASHCPLGEPATLLASPSFYITGVGSQIYVMQDQVVFQFF